MCNNQSKIGLCAQNLDTLMSSKVNIIQLGSMWSLHLEGYKKQ